MVLLEVSVLIIVRISSLYLLSVEVLGYLLLAFVDLFLCAFVQSLDEWLLGRIIFVGFPYCRMTLVNTSLFVLHVVLLNQDAGILRWRVLLMMSCLRTSSLNLLLEGYHLDKTLSGYFSF